MVGAPKEFHWLFYLTVPLPTPHISLLIHILYLYPKQIPGGTHPVSSHVLPCFEIHYLYLASLPLITCLNSNAPSIVIFLLFDFLFPYPLFLALTLSGLLRPCDWQLPITNNNTIKKNGWENVNDYSFQRKNQAVTLGSKTTVVIDGDPVQVDPQLLFQRRSVIATREEQEDPAALFKIRALQSGFLESQTNCGTWWCLLEDSETGSDRPSWWRSPLRAWWWCTLATSAVVKRSSLWEHMSYVCHVCDKSVWKGNHCLRWLWRWAHHQRCYTLQTHRQLQRTKSYLHRGDFIEAEEKWVSGQQGKQTKVS